MIEMINKIFYFIISKVLGLFLWYWNLLLYIIFAKYNIDEIMLTIKKSKNWLVFFKNLNKIELKLFFLIYFIWKYIERIYIFIIILVYVVCN